MIMFNMRGVADSDNPWGLITQLCITSERAGNIM